MGFGGVPGIPGQRRHPVFLTFLGIRPVFLAWLEWAPNRYSGAFKGCISDFMLRPVLKLYPIQSMMILCAHSLSSHKPLRVVLWDWMQDRQFVALLETYACAHPVSLCCGPHYLSANRPHEGSYSSTASSLGTNTK